MLAFLAKFVFFGFVAVATTIGLVGVTNDIINKSVSPPISPTPTSIVVLTPTSIPSKKAAVTGNTVPYKGNTIDCVGPDGKHLQITQNACDDFNNAWKNYKTVQVKNAPTNQGSSNVTNQNSSTIQNSSQNTQNSAQYSQCTSNAFSNYNACTSKCSSERSTYSEICAQAYMGSHPLVQESQSKYDECINETNAKNKTCWDACGVTQSSELSGCHY